MAAAKLVSVLAELLESLKEVLDQMAPFVHLGIVRDGGGAIRFCRDDGGGAPVVQDGAQRALLSCRWTLTIVPSTMAYSKSGSCAPGAALFPGQHESRSTASKEEYAKGNKAKPNSL